jgi:hypothetical protein
MYKFSKLHWGALALLLINPGCGSSSSTTASVDLSSYFPTSVAVSSPTASTAGSSSLSLKDISAFDTDATDSAAEKEAKLEALASGAATCAVDIQVVSSSNANCYGPSLSYTTHPADASSGTFPGGDLGIINAATVSGEACASAQINSRLRGVGSQVDSGMFAMASLFCAAGKAATAIPAESSSVDLTTNMAGLVSINGVAATVVSATLARDADATDGRPVYISSYQATIGTKTYDIRLKHAPDSTTLTDFRGKISVKVADADGTKPGNCGSSTATGHTMATSVAYESTAATGLIYQLQSAQFCGDDADPWVSATDYSVDYTKKLDMPTVPKGWANDANFILTSDDSTTSTFLYGWQAGANDSNTRVFDAAITKSTSTTGTAFFGFGPEMATSTGRGIATKMICNWAGPGNNHTGITKVQKQTMTQTAGIFAATTSSIVYDPVNSCEDGNVSFVLSGTVDGSAFSRSADTTTMDLVNATEVGSTITAPTAPTNVDL